MRKRPGQHERQPLQRLRQRLGGRSFHVVGQVHAQLRQALNDLHVVRRAQEQVRCVRDLRANAIHGCQLLFGGGHKRFHRRERSRQGFGHRLAHVTHPQAEQWARERTGPRLIDGRDQLLRHNGAHANGLALLVQAAGFQLSQLHLVKRVEVGDVAHAAGVDQAAHQLLAHAVDVHSTAAHPMQQAFKRLSWTINGNAAVVGLAFLAHDRAAAARARLRHLPFGSPVGAKRLDRPQNLGDHVAGLADDDGIAHANILAAHFVLVVQRGTRNGRTGDEHRLQLGHRREFARTPDLHRYVAQQRRLLFRRKLVCDGPTRRAGGVAHGLLLREAVHLHHHAVDVVRQRVSAL